MYRSLCIQVDCFASLSFSLARKSSHVIGVPWIPLFLELAHKRRFTTRPRWSSSQRRRERRQRGEHGERRIEGNRQRVFPTWCLRILASQAAPSPEHDAECSERRCRPLDVLDNMGTTTTTIPRGSSAQTRTSFFLPIDKSWPGLCLTGRSLRGVLRYASSSKNEEVSLEIDASRASSRLCCSSILLHIYDQMHSSIRPVSL